MSRSDFGLPEMNNEVAYMRDDIVSKENDNGLFVKAQNIEMQNYRRVLGAKCLFEYFSETSVKACLFE